MELVALSNMYTRTIVLYMCNEQNDGMHHQIVFPNDVEHVALRELVNPVSYIRDSLSTLTCSLISNNKLVLDMIRIGYIYCYAKQGFIQRGGETGIPPPRIYENFIIIEKSVQIVNGDKYPLTFPRFVDASIDSPPPPPPKPKILYEILLKTYYDWLSNKNCCRADATCSIVICMAWTDDL